MYNYNGGIDPTECDTVCEIKIRVRKGSFHDSYKIYKSFID